MKNQYVGDIGDYGKYALLRAFASHYRIGVNWYLTENDQSNDGNMRAYLSNPSMRIYDPELYDSMKRFNAPQHRDVALIESAGLISEAIFYSDILKSESLSVDERYQFRDTWHQQALKTLQCADLVFCDPDNGPLGSKSVGNKQSEKFVSLAELSDYYNRGHNVVYYCQKARRNDAQWERTKKEMLTKVSDASIIVLTFHSIPQRSYIFVVHPCDKAKYKAIIDSFLQVWTGPFTEETV